MSWRERAVPVNSGGGWRSRAVPVQVEEPMSLSGFSSNLWGDVKNIAKIPGAVTKLGMLPPRELGQVAGEALWNALPHPEWSEEQNKIQMKPGAILERGKEIVLHPGKSMYENPLMTPLDVATVGYPVLSGTKIGRAAASAGRMLGETATTPIKPLFRGVKSVGRKTASAVFGPTEEAIKEYMTRPEAIKAAAGKNTADIAFDVERGYNVVGEQLKGLEKQTKKLLRKSSYLEEGAIGKDQIQNVIENARSKIGFTVTPNEQYVKTVLDNVSENLKGLRNTVSESQQRDIVQKLSDAINYGKKEYGKSDLALMEVRSNIDSLLKRNPGYKRLMKKESKRIRLQDDIADRFGFQRSVGEGLIATDTTASKLKSVLGETKEVQSQKILRRLKGATGNDALQSVKDYKVAEQFQPGATRPQGSRRVMGLGAIGAGIGGTVGGPAGATIGSVLGVGTGMYIDKQGGAILAKIINAYLSAKQRIPDLSIQEFLSRPEVRAAYLAERGTESRTTPTKKILRDFRPAESY